MMSRFRYWGGMAALAVVVLLGATGAFALDVVVDIVQNSAPSGQRVDNGYGWALNKYYQHNGVVYQIGQQLVNAGGLNPDYYIITHTAVPNATIDSITYDDYSATVEGDTTGSGTLTMGNTSNTVTVRDDETITSDGITIGNSIDMSNGTDNQLDFTTGTLTGGTIIEVGEGNINIGVGGGAPNIAGTITTDKAGADASQWEVESGTVSGSLQLGFDGVGTNVMEITGTKFTGTGNVQAISSGTGTTKETAANKITVSTGAVFEIGTGIYSTGSNNYIRVEGNADMQAGSTISMIGGKSYLDLFLGVLDANDPNKTVVASKIILTGGGNTLDVGANSLINADTNMTSDAAGNNNYIFQDWSEFSADWQNVEGNGNTLLIDEAADFNGSINFTGGDITATVRLTRGSDGTLAPKMTGQIVFNDTTGSTDKNTVNIISGTLTNANGSVIASNVVDTDFNVTGGLTNLLVSGNSDTDNPKSTYTITDGNVYNIRQQDGTTLAHDGADWKTGYVNKGELPANELHSVTYGDGIDGDRTYQSYSILNVDTVTTTADHDGARTITSIGGFDRDADLNGKYDTVLDDTILNQDNTWGQGNYGNQLTTNILNVNTGSKLIIHADATHLGEDEADLAGRIDEKSIANTTTVTGELTLDRSSLHGSTYSGEAKITVESGGILYGFGEDGYTLGDPYANHYEQYEQLRANLYGNLTLNTGATLQNYDLGLANSYYQYGLKFSTDGLFDDWDYDAAGIADEHRGSVFRVGTENGNGGLSTFMNGSIMRSRLFHGVDGRKVQLVDQRNDNGSTVMDTQYSDSLLTVNADFSDVFAEVNSNTGWDAQAKKVQYDPVFGFQYDLKSKQEFDIYLDEDSQDKTYYYAVVNSENAIGQLVNYDDANHLFNKLILKSDMLGKYDFLKSADNSSIYLRYRQLAYHPTEGGIKRTMSEGANRNEIVPGQYLDEIRYPFSGQPGSDLNGVLPHDPSEDTDSYNKAGYNGEMWGDGDGFYADPTLSTRYPVFDNVREDWIKDWENLFQGMQLDVAANDDMYRAVRMLHAETYANVSQTAFDVMGMFIRNRERNAVSALFQVENEFYEEAMETAGAGSDAAYASVADHSPDDFYVRNPVRFWASGFGAYGRQMESNDSDNTMGYSNTTWGGSVGVVKEFGDYYVGGTVGYADTKTRYDYADVTAKNYIAEALVGARIFCLGFAELYAGYSYGDTKNRRVVDLASNQLGGYHGVGTGEFGSHTFSAGARIGYQKTFGDNWLFLPTVGVNVLHYRAGAFTESGRANMANLLVFKDGSMDRTMVRIPVEFRLNRAVAVNDYMLMPELRAGITPLLGDKRGQATAKWVGNPIDNRYFTSVGGSRGSFEGWVGATVELSKKGRFYAAANYDYTYSANHGAHNYSIQAGLNF